MRLALGLRGNHACGKLRTSSNNQSQHSSYSWSDSSSKEKFIPYLYCKQTDGYWFADVLYHEIVTCINDIWKTKPKGGSIQRSICIRLPYLPSVEGARCPIDSRRRGGTWRNSWIIEEPFRINCIIMWKFGCMCVYIYVCRFVCAYIMCLDAYTKIHIEHCHSDAFLQPCHYYRHIHPRWTRQKCISPWHCGSICGVIRIHGGWQVRFLGSRL